ncbi:outer membrane protein/peptidoglycan-associated (lipo)protein [Saprospira grandis DSM 2844]|uniref:Outer membrane protein/peptidoglycan-associated (Lipo)protein n=1 Tax=Saprospira grandis DSM 2844 TaxID=694433 RepID=J1I6I6_9BACT|nr:OmpA family protein [Saprospira grandis]EJF54405.1 outer membrane protein/peptidoglycan-associated (lipo)protein [Saprospira grandis DSM 2844]
MYKYWLPLLVLALLSLQACSYTERIKDGSTAYDRKQFSVAIPMLQKEFKKAKENKIKGQKAYELAESYRRTHQYKEAANWYAEASQLRYATDAALQQAKMLQQAEDYELAIQAYRTAGRDAGDANRYLEYIQACRQAKQWLALADSSVFSIDNLPFNTEATDFSPALQNENTLVFSSDREESEGKKNYKWTNKKFFDFYSLDLKTDSLQRLEVRNWDPNFHQGNLVFSADGQWAFFTECGSDKKEGVDFCRLMMAEKAGSSWSKAKEIRLGGKFVNYMHPCIDPEGRWLIFAANDKKGFGGYDLYISLWVSSEERWSEPQNMGNEINTQGNEVFPALEADTLYFASDGHPGMGGLDIFKAPRLLDRWVKPQNLKAPINSGADDFGLIVNPYAEKEDSIIRKGYFSSNRNTGRGGDDIYAFTEALPKEPIEADTLEEKEFQLLLAGMVKEVIPADSLNGEPAQENPLMGASVRISTQDTVWIMGSDVDGSFFSQLDTNETYFFQTTKAGYFTALDTLSTFNLNIPADTNQWTLAIQIELAPFEKGKEIVLENVYFDYNKWDIRPDAAEELNKLVRLLNENPDLNIEMGSHTDCRGRESYNQSLSQKRAESTMQYLIQAGISDSRLQAKGYGESSPAASCDCNSCTEEEHQRNRRTSFVILD